MVFQLVSILLALVILVSADQITEQLDEIGARVRREASGPGTDAMEAAGRAMATRPVGKIDFSRPTLRNPYFNNMKNFGGRVGGSAGVKIFQSGAKSAGVGLGAEAIMGLARGRPFANTPGVGAAASFQNGPFSASVKGSHQSGGPTNYGAGVRYDKGAFSATAGIDHQRRGPTEAKVGVEYRFKRSTSSLEDADPKEVIDIIEEGPEESREDINNSEDGPKEPERKKRQVTYDAMQRSLTNNPVGKPEFRGPTLQGGYFRDMKNFGGQVGGSAGVKVWESGRNSVGLGAAGAANTGLARGRPFMNTPEIGAGVGYRRGPFSATVGVGRQHRGQTTYGLGVGYRFRRSALQHEDDETEEYMDDLSVEDVEEAGREKRQVTTDAMQRSLTNNPVGKPEFGTPSLHGGYFHDMKNFGGRASGSAGVKVWESGRKSVGLGGAGAANLGMTGGRPYANSPELGAAVGYHHGPFSASVGAGRQFHGRGSTNYGVGLSYRFRRSVEDEEDNNDDSEPEIDEEDLKESKESEHALTKRQISETAGRAMDISLTNLPRGQLDHTKDIDNRYFDDRRNFGGRATGSVGTRVWERNEKSVGVGLAAESHIGLSNGRPFASPPRAGVGVGYRQGPFSASVGMDRGRGRGGSYTNNYGVRFSYDFPRGKREIADMQDEE